ncbi:SDR family oxidoreductase [Flagellimonas meridianipacifica]|uniref:Short-subunit dehydrogenase n=1 Tax=Flagellimonas meridianipacifica TaxID=1080225 RepID=A0A2T0MAN1_9FLAO|nr:SDR family oxidoreductase [Allomuricauda pacifica]PRX54545.1 short-subunit dehydrogenase [Allomuricauda pacifica]
MDSKVVLITGGSSGIGKAIGTFLTEKGYKVYGTARDVQKYPDFTAFKLIDLDVRDDASAQLAVERVLEREGRLDILINNAGVGITGPVEETSQDAIENVFNINLYGPVRMMKTVLPQMREQNSGLIINITSIAGFMGLPYRGFYSASKGALGILTESIRMETKGFGIKITNVAPGDFATNIAAGRYHSPLLEDSPYKEPYSSALTSMDDHVDSGGNPIDVAKKIYGIIQQNHPKVHNPVGAFLQKFSLRLKRILPDKVYEKMLLNHYKL